MGSVRTRQTIRIPLLWTDASQLGAFVDYLYQLIEPELDTTDMHPSAAEFMLSRAVPSWRIKAGPRVISADGSWRDVENEISWQRARSISVSVTGPETDFTLTSYWPYVDLDISSTSASWLDQNLPAIRSRLRRLSPRWSALAWKPVYMVVAFLGTPVLLGFGSLPKGDPRAAFGWIGAAMYLVGGLMLAIPPIRLGPQPRPFWLRALLWVAGLVAAGLVGAVIAKMLNL